jgi:hypothetical protein
VRAAHDRDLDEVGMPQQHLLDLARVDIAAAADDLLDPVGLLSPAVLRARR